MPSFPDFPGAKYPDLDWQAFGDEHKAWARERLTEDDVLHCLPPDALDAALSLYQLHAEEVAAEADLAELCERHDAIGWTANGPLQYPLLRDPTPLPTADEMKWFLDHGWTQETIDSGCQFDAPYQHLLRRWRSAPGRLISRHDFLLERDGLRTAWLALPTAKCPALPLQRPLRRFRLDAEFLGERLSGAEESFWKSFDDFCDRWQLLEMTTWDLPAPDGPQWPRLTPGPFLSAGVQLQTPWHFPVQESDGVGKFAMNAHEKASAERQIDDHGSWATYASLLRIAYWQHVLAERYSRQQQVGAFMTHMEPVLAALLGMSVDRVQKLRKTLAALQSGRRTSLAGRR